MSRSLHTHGDEILTDSVHFTFMKQYKNVLAVITYRHPFGPFIEGACLTFQGVMNIPTNPPMRMTHEPIF